MYNIFSPLIVDLILALLFYLSMATYAQVNKNGSKREAVKRRRIAS